MCEPDPHTYAAWLDRVEAKGMIRVAGATPEELAVIRAALNLYHTRNAEKHVHQPDMGWGERAKIAEELEVRIVRIE